MVRFKWSFYKCLEFVDNKIPNMEIKKKTFLQLKKIALEYEQDKQVSTDWWTDYSNDPEELLLRNTYLNSSRFLNLRQNSIKGR